MVLFDNLFGTIGCILNMKTPEEFLEDWSELRKRGLNCDEVQYELTKRGYSATILADWEGVDYNEFWLCELLKG